MSLELTLLERATLLAGVAATSSIKDALDRRGITPTSEQIARIVQESREPIRDVVARELATAGDDMTPLLHAACVVAVAVALCVCNPEETARN